MWREILDALRGRERDYTSGSLPRAIVLLAIPMVLEWSMESVFAVVDMYFVRHLGDDAIAAVGITESLMSLVYAVAIGMSMSAAALVARRIGEKNKDGAVRAATAALAIGLLAGATLGVPAYFLADGLLDFMGASDAVVANGAGYTRLIIGFNVVVMLLHLANGIFRGAGDAAMAMRSLWIANAVNLVLDPCLIFGLGPFPEMGLTGAALATVIGRGTGVLFQVLALTRGAGRLRLRGPAFRLHSSLVLEILRLSVGSIGQFAISTLSWVALMRIVAPFGDAAVAGYTIALRIVIFAFLPAWGLTNAAATLVGQNLGARAPERAERAVWLTGIYTMAFLAVVTVVFLVFGPDLVAIYTDKPDTAGTAVDALRILSYGYVFYAWAMVMLQAFNGAGDTMTPTRLNFVCFWLIQVPLAWTLARLLDLGPSGVFWSVCIAESLLAVLSILVFRTGGWKATKVAADVAEPLPGA